jgi:ribosomal-protein-alanine N-acetyltransferase
MLRNLFASDLQTLLAIEQAAHAVPWTEETFKICFEIGHLGWAMELNGRVIGFIIVSMRPEECHILNLCVARTHQHQGYGRQMLRHALTVTKQKGAAVVYLEVRRSNSRAIALYKKEHFMQIGERKGYYPTVSANEDALIFAKTL